MDDDLRIALWNKLHVISGRKLEAVLSSTYYEDFINVFDGFKYPLDKLDDWFPATFQIIKIGF